MTAYKTADGLPGIALTEWQEGHVPDVVMTDRDLRLAARLRALPRDALLNVQPAEGGVVLKTTGAVGVVRFTNFEARIDAKLPGDHLQLFRMLEFASGLDGLVQLAGSPQLRALDANLLDLIVELLSHATESILAGGVRADYVEREGHIPALRGRMLSDRQVLERFGLNDRVVCRYDEHEHDILDNQLLALSLARGSRIATLPRVKRRARALAALLEEICDPRDLAGRLDPALFAYSRHNEHYRTAHALCWMVLHGQGLDEALKAGVAEVRSFLIDMNTLFERFLERVLRVALAKDDVIVEAQRSDSIFWREDTRARYARVRPDLLVQGAERLHARLPVDAKYKRYDDRRVDVGDLTQAFVYAYAYRDPEAVGPPRAILVHPSETPGEPRVIPLQIRSVAERAVDADIAVVGIHIPTFLEGVRHGGAAVDDLRRVMIGMLPPSRSASARLEERGVPA